MNEIKFAIYGGGHRGQRLLNYLGASKVVAFVDSDINKIGNVIQNIPIVSLDDYKELYNNVHIIISPSQHEEIEKILNIENITCYSRLSDLPSEFCGYGTASFTECYNDIIKKYDMPSYIRGNNAFALLLSESLEKVGNETYFIDSVIKPDFGLLFIATGESEEKIKELYPKLKIIDAFYHSNRLPRYFNGSIAKLKNKYKNLKRCFIVATGPSLRKQDVERIKNNGEFCISVNRIFLLDTVWRPDIYMVTDSVFMMEEKEKIKNYNVKLKIYADCNTPPDDKGEVVHVVSDVCDENPRFSEDVAQMIYGGGTVTYAAIQFAVYLGIKNIYLLGVDCDYKIGSRTNHFYEICDGDKIDHKTDKMIRAFKVAQIYALQNGLHIYNATRGGKLEVFERVDFDSLF
ncbi:MAG: DUF115 domain-containing protein [Selenomonadaceae bacterium]|nr:DUF115 domain-containing protein [Selenomonadaceae bacterium]